MKYLLAVALLAFAQFGHAYTLCASTDTTAGDTRVYQPCTKNPIPTVTTILPNDAVDIWGPYHIAGCGDGAVSPAWSGTVPSGLTINPTTGRITGAPETAGSYSSSLTCTNSIGAETVDFTWDVLSGAVLIASGYGSGSSYGSSGTATCVVTNSNDTGAGSLRQCLSDAVDGAGTTITWSSAVGGTIVLGSELAINKSAITIDATNANSRVTIAKSTASDNTRFTINAWTDGSRAHDLLIKGLAFDGRWDRDSSTGTSLEKIFGIDSDGATGSTPLNIVIDQVTIKNAGDSAFDVWGSATDVQLRNSVVMYNYHPCSMSFEDDSQARRRISVINSLFYSADERMCQIRGDIQDVEFVNTVIAGWGLYATRLINRDSPVVPDNINFLNTWWLDYDPPLKNISSAAAWAGDNSLVFSVATSTACYDNGSVTRPATENESCTGTQSSRADATVAPTLIPKGSWCQTLLANVAAPSIGSPFPSQEEQDVFTEVCGQIGVETGSLFEFAWDKPDELPTGAAIGAGVLTGYTVYKASGETYSAVATINNPDDTNYSTTIAGKYAVAATWTADVAGLGSISSQTALSEPVDTDYHYTAADCDYTYTNSNSGANTKAAINSDLASAAAGEVFCFRGAPIGTAPTVQNGGLYAFDWATDNEPLLLPQTQDGTSGSEIVIISYPGEWATFKGCGSEALFDSQDALGVNAGCPAVSGDNQLLFDIRGDHVRIMNLTVQDSDNDGIDVSGSNILFYNVQVYQSYKTNIRIGHYIGESGYPSTVSNVVCDYCDISHSRHNYGWRQDHTGNQHPSNSNIYDSNGTRRSLMWSNGRRPSDNGPVGIVQSDPGGGGNADGYASGNLLSKQRSNNATIDVAQNSFMFKSMAFNNADNQFDGSYGAGLIVNRSVGASRRDFTPVIKENGDYGATGGLAFKNFEPGTGPYYYFDSLAYSASLTLGGAGFSPKMNTDEEAYMYQLTAMDLSAQSFLEYGPGGVSTHKAKGLHSHETSAEDLGGYEQSNNLFDTDGLLNDDDIELPFPDDLTGDTPKERWNAWWRVVENAFMPSSPSSPVIDAGFKSPYHCATANDDATNPCSPDDYTVIRWFTNQFSGDTDDPDAGSNQYQYILPPMNMRIQ